MPILSDSPVHRLHVPLSASRWRDYSARDIWILDFLWRWKLATSSTLHAVYCRDSIVGPCTANAFYQVLKRLQRLKHIESCVHPRHNIHYWQLTPKAFKSLQESLGPVKEKGFKSENPWHDLHVTAFQLGSWMSEKIPGVEFITEQQLRRYKLDDLPDWVPNNSINHEFRHDGYPFDVD